MENATPLDAEIDQLKAELRSDPRFARLKQLERMREEYLALPQATASSPPKLQLQLRKMQLRADDGDGRTPGRKRSPERERALEETTKFLAGKTAPTRLGEIDEHLERLGIRIGGSDPLNNLSALLSTSGQFRAHGRAGWTIMEQGNA
jgi:hypothetical protein